ncbi:enoyl-CoA hydratase/isomerase family protein [Actinocrispum sp. NPDC049592]|uniref:enoyl-CoA hydratase/isomerase family protein n=1 Tax=Actinocrispum sp. NPDC049592 TaxID=3154835 RepID=UPI0034344982
MGLVLERSDDCLRLKLNRPSRRNALTEHTVKALLSALDSTPTLPLILGSADPAVFCAGADLTVPDDERTRLSDLLYQCYERMITRPGPVIAVITGAAVGGGAQLAAAADLRISGPGARFRWVGPGHGLAVGAWILPSLIGRSAALDLLISSRWLDAEEAYRLGFTGLVDDPWAAAEQLVTHIGTLDRDAVARIKSISAADGLLQRLADERMGNRSTWSGAV